MIRLNLERFRQPLCCFYFPTLCSAAAGAETGSLVGVVRGPGGVGLPGATVTAHPADDHSATSVVSGESGAFRIDDLEPGTYTVEGEIHGFHPRRPKRSQSTAASVARVEMSLSVATFRDTMQVDSQSPHDSLEASELRESTARDLGEALAGKPGVWKVRKGGIANDVVVRGYSQDDLTMLIDGARVAGACPNRMDPPAFPPRLSRRWIGSRSDPRPRAWRPRGASAASSTWSPRNRALA